MAKLTAKQQRFTEEYLIDLNATQAALRAGYKNADIGRQLLTKNNVSAEIQRKMAERSVRTGITQDHVLQELANVAFSRGSDYARVVYRGGIAGVELTPTDTLTDEQKAAIAGIKETQTGIEVKAYDKIRALELLGKHLGLFADRNAAPLEPVQEDDLSRSLEALGKELESDDQ